MKEIYEFRINQNYAKLLFKEDEGKNLSSVKVIKIDKDDPRFYKIGEIQNELCKKDEVFYFSLDIIREYTKNELDRASLLKIIFKKWFTICPEEFGTKYDNTTECDICGVGSSQIGPLKISKSKIPKSDISILLGSEVIVTDKFVEAFSKHRLKGAEFGPIFSGKNQVNSYQLISDSHKLNLSNKIRTGDDPFDLLKHNDVEIYRCSKKHLIWIYILSELYVKKIPDISKYDIYTTYEHTGTRGGYLRPYPFYVCSQKFREMVEKEKLTGFSFEVVHIV